MSHVMTRMADGELSPKAVAAGLLAAVTPYLMLLLTQYADTGVVHAADARKLIVSLLTGAITFAGAWLARPGDVVPDVPDVVPDEPDPTVYRNDDLPRL